MIMPSEYADLQVVPTLESDVPCFAPYLGVPAFRVQNYRNASRALSQVLAGNSSDPCTRPCWAPPIYVLDNYREAVIYRDPRRTRHSLHPSAIPWAAVALSPSDTLRKLPISSRIYESSDLLPTHSSCWVPFGPTVPDLRPRRYVPHRSRLLAIASTRQTSYFAGLAHFHGIPNESTRGIQRRSELASRPIRRENWPCYVYLQQPSNLSIDLFRSVIATLRKT